VADEWEQGDEAVRVALELACDVRDGEPARLHARVRSLARNRPLLLEQVVVALAAMVPDDTPVAELLAWTDPLMPAERRRAFKRAELDARRYRAARPGRLEVVPPDGRVRAEGSAS
jgi:hypothetical protein